MKKIRWILILAILLLITFVIRTVSDKTEEKANASAYSQALELLRDEHFEEAEKLLRPLTDIKYKYSEELLRYARAKQLDEDDLDGRIDELGPIGDYYAGDLAEDDTVDNVYKYHGVAWTWEGDLPVFSSSGTYYSGSENNSSSGSDDRSVDADDHDLDLYYYDYEDDYENFEDAWDGFEDDEGTWEDY